MLPCEPQNFRRQKRNLVHFLQLRDRSSETPFSTTKSLLKQRNCWLANHSDPAVDVGWLVAMETRPKQWPARVRANNRDVSQNGAPSGERIRSASSQFAVEDGCFEHYFVRYVKE